MSEKTVYNSETVEYPDQEPADDGKMENFESPLGIFIDNNNIISSFNENDIISNKLEEPFNQYDPHVYHDPQNEQPFIVRLKNTINPADGIGDMEPDVNDERINAKLIPVVRLNTIVLDPENIEAVTITCTEFLPELTLIVKDVRGKFNLPVHAGLNNIIQVCIMPSIDGKYKKITLPFYITNVETNIWRDSMTYTGKLKHFPLLQQCLATESNSIEYTKCMTSVDKNDKCIENDEPCPNMWQLFHEIAIRTKLGFAAMPGLKDYTDNMPRNINSQSYKEFLEYNLLVGGSNAHQIYDGWVDLWGYIVLVDVYKILNADVRSENLAFYAQTGFHAHNKEYMDEKFSSVRRVLHNSNMTKAKSNLEIEEFYDTADFGKITDHGTLRTMYYFCPFGNGDGINNIKAEQIRIKEDSKDGNYVEDYEVQKYCGWSFVGCEERNIAKQMEVRDSYLTKIKNANGKMTIRLTNPNYALQRGTLVTIIRMKYDHEYKVKIFNQESNLYPNSLKKGYAPDTGSKGENDGITTDDILMNDGIGVVCVENSGIYYIDGMRFDYINGNEKIQQYLYLIKKGPLTGLNNLTTINRFKFPF